MRGCLETTGIGRATSLSAAVPVGREYNMALKAKQKISTLFTTSTNAAEVGLFFHSKARVIVRKTMYIESPP